MARARLAIILILLAAMSVPIACEKPPRTTTPIKKTGVMNYDADYIGALAVANDLCQAWKAREYAVGKALLTRRLVRRHPEARLKDAIVGSANPIHVSYEITGSRKISPSEIEFQIRLFLRYIGEVENRIEMITASLVVIREYGKQWRVDEFPIPTDNVSLEPSRKPS